MSIPQLTFTRFLAAITVVFVHFGWSAYPLNSSGFSTLGIYFTSFVSYFFVLSGFILVVSGYKDHQLLPTINKQVFWIHRFARIYPLYIFAIIVHLMVTTKATGFLDFFGYDKAVARAVFLIQSWYPETVLWINFPGWSLSVEALFYFSFPFLYVWIKHFSLYKQLFIASVLWILNLSIHIFMMNHKMDENLIKFYPLFHLSTFIVGIVAGFSFINYREQLTINKKYVYLLLVVVSLFFGICIAQNFSFMRYHHNGMFVPLFVLILFSLGLSDGIVSKTFSLKPFVYLGEISYGVYLFQVPIYIFFIQKNTMFQGFSENGKLYSYIAVLLVFSVITHELIEKPMKNLIRKKGNHILLSAKNNFAHWLKS